MGNKHETGGRHINQICLMSKCILMATPSPTILYWWYFIQDIFTSSLKIVIINNERKDTYKNTA